MFFYKGLEEVLQITLKMQTSNPPRDHSRPNVGCMSTKEKEKYVENFSFPYCAEADKYEKVAKIGQGTFGFVTHSFS